MFGGNLRLLVSLFVNYRGNAINEIEPWDGAVPSKQRSALLLRSCDIAQIYRATLDAELLAVVPLALELPHQLDADLRQSGSNVPRRGHREQDPQRPSILAIFFHDCGGIGGSVKSVLAPKVPNRLGLPSL